MYRGKRILVVVPARGGSKGVPLKNLQRVGGRSLVGWAGQVIGNTKYIDRAVVSTDHEEIAAEAEANGIAAPFRRPVDLSGDRIGDVQVLQHALGETERLDGVVYDVIVMLQPTSPSRKPSHVEDAIRILVEGGYESVWSVSETDLKSHPLKQLVIDEDGKLQYYDPSGATIIARQQLTPVYHRNGVVYAVTRECLMTENTLLGNNSSPLIIREPVVNIDTKEDLLLAESQFGGL